MKLNTTDFRRKCQHPVLLALGGFPLALMLIVNLAPALLGRIWVFPAACVLLGWGCILLPGKVRLPAGAAGAAAILLLGTALLPVRENFFLVLVPLLYMVLLGAALPIGGWPRGRELQTAWYMAGVVTHVLLQLVINGSKRMQTGAYDAVQLPLLVSFVLYAVLTLLALNRSSLDSAAMSRRTVPLLMRRQNIVITLGLLALGVIIAAVPAIGELLGGLWDAVIRAVAFLVGLLMSLYPKTTAPAGGAAAPEAADMGLGGTAQASALALILEKVITVAALAVLALALVFLVRTLARKLLQLLRYLWQRMALYSAAAGEDYEDEITDTRDEPDTEREGLLGRLRRYGRRDEKGATPSEQVRWRYRRLKARHTQWHRASTARETLPAAAAELYERTRYGGQALTAEEAERFQAETRNV